jgi:hypothetical protein
LKRIIESWSAEELYSKRSQIQYPDYQREPRIWNSKKRQKLIDSMLRGLDIPKIYLYKNKNGQYDCVDGQQRIETVFEFFDGYSNLPDGRNWDRLSPKEQTVISEYNFTVALITQASEEELRLLFLRLQLGAPLNVGEKLNAIKGDIRNFVFHVGKTHPFFVRVRIPKRRYAKETVFAQICINSFHRSIFKSFYGARYDQLSAFFEQYAHLAPFEKEIDLIKYTLDEMYRCFGENTSKLRNRAVIVSGYLFFEELIRDEKLDKLQTFSEFYLKFLDILQEQTLKGFEYDRKYREILDFQSLVIQAAVSRKSIEQRHEMIREYFEHYLETKKIKTVKF